MIRRIIVLAALTSLLAAIAVAQDAAMPPGFDPQRHMRVTEVKDGQKGYGLTVFKGTKIEKFDVEVISVLHNFNPRHDVVLVRCKGATLEHTGAIAGMSGSPIFLTDDQGHDRMIGAFAYGWPLMKDPIGGVQPIEYMLALPTHEKTAEADGATKAADAPEAAGATIARNGRRRKRWPRRGSSRNKPMRSHLSCRRRPCNSPARPTRPGG